MLETYERYMRLALVAARRARQEGNDPYGAVDVRGAEVVEGHNLVNWTCDPTAHAEVVAPRYAATRGTLAICDARRCTQHRASN